MSRVWRAWYRPLGAWCAVKVLRERYVDDALTRHRFAAEGQILSAISHAHVIRAYEVGERPIPYIVMEIAEGGNLKDWMSRNGVMAPTQAVRAAIEICQGLGAAHEIAVVHRDMKPQNVLFDRQGRCRISDFGIARTPWDDPRGAPDDKLGTLAYMSPDHPSDPGRADPRIDVYGVGATLYDLLTNAPHPHLFADGALDPRLVPAPLVGIIRRACAYRLEDRWSSLRELSDALLEELPSLRDPPGLRLLLDDLPESPEPPDELQMDELVDGASAAFFSSSTGRSMGSRSVVPALRSELPSRSMFAAAAVGSIVGLVVVAVVVLVLAGAWAML